MNRTLSFVRLDFITVKPYATLKNLIIFVAVALIMIISSGGGSSAIGILMVYAVLFSSYPFAVGEKNGIDALYVTLSIKRSTVVLGRYLFAIIVDVCAGLLACAFTFAILALLRINFTVLETFIEALALLMILSLLQAVQIPIFFKLGYTKAKFMAYLPFLGLPLVVISFQYLVKDRVSSAQLTGLFEWIAANPVAVVLFCAFLWLAAMAISCKVSQGLYGKRDF
jgi:hypothetical protein